MQLESAQQYNIATRGYPPLYAWAKEHVAKLHAPPTVTDTVITDSASHTIAVRCFLETSSTETSRVAFSSGEGLANMHLVAMFMCLAMPQVY